jgi:hypothetical protein
LQDFISMENKEKQNNNWVWCCVIVVPATRGKHKMRGSLFGPAWAKCKDLSPK